MEEKFVPDVQEIFDELRAEISLEFPKQRAAMLQRILKTPAENFHEVHIEDWYNRFWLLAGISAQVGKLSEAEENICAKFLNDAKNFDATTQQLYALGLILFGKLDAAKNLIDTKFWSKRLRENFLTYESWRKIITGGPNLEGRARLLRDRQIKKFLIEKFSYVIERHAKTVINNKNCPKVAPKDYQIFYGWLQGEENLPPLARCCYNSMKMNAAPYKITFIDEKNYSDYVDIPQYIFEKFKAGKMKPAHFTDVIRINLLERYGGLWLDATILLTEPLDKYKKFLRLPFFTQKFTHEKDNDHPITKGFASYSAYARWGGFVQGSSVVHNPLFAFMKDFYNEYWREFDEIIDYVLMDFMIDIAYDNIPAVKREIDEVPINNENIWTLSPYLNTPYKNFPYDKILQGNFLNKFSSRKQLDFDAEDTVLREIQKRYAPETL